MSSKANSATLFFVLNILFFSQVSNLAQCRAPMTTLDVVSTTNPLSVPNPVLTPDPLPILDSFSTSDPLSSIPEVVPTSNSEPPSSTPAAPASGSSCSLDPKTVAMCGASLSGGLSTLLTSGIQPCCQVLKALDRSQASVCLCSLLKYAANHINLDMPTVNMLPRLCQVQGPIVVECA